METLNVVLPDEMLAVLNEAVERGDYVSTSEAVREALKEWTLRRSQREVAHRMLGQLWDVGMASGPAQGADAVFARIEATLKADADR